jgi:hypothetical protein
MVPDIRISLRWGWGDLKEKIHCLNSLVRKSLLAEQLL